MFDREGLEKRIAQMSDLPEDWDGCGTSPVSSSVARIGKRLLQYIPDEAARSVKVFVGVNTPGSLFVEIVQGSRSVEMTVVPGGNIYWDELICGIVCGGGQFILSRHKFAEILDG